VRLSRPPSRAARGCPPGSFSELLVRNGLRKKVDQLAVVRHGLYVRMGKVGSPQQALRRRLDQRRRKWHRVRETAFRPLTRVPVRSISTQASSLFIKSSSFRKGFLIDPVLRLDAPHVVDDERHALAAEHSGMSLDVFRRRNAAPRAKRAARSSRACVRTRADPARRPDAARRLKRTPRTPPACSASSSRSVGLSPTIATPRQAPPGSNFRDQAIASSIARLSAPWQLACTSTARANTQMLVQRAQLLLRGVGRRVAALGRVGKLRRRAEDVAVRVAGAGRWVSTFGLTGFGSGPAIALVIRAASLFFDSGALYHRAPLDDLSREKGPECLGVPARASTPRSCSRLRTSGAETAALTSRLSRSITTLGVFAGAATPFHEAAW